jgi:hypothetical protein
MFCISSGGSGLYRGTVPYHINTVQYFKLQVKKKNIVFNKKILTGNSEVGVEWGGGDSCNRWIEYQALSSFEMLNIV